MSPACYWAKPVIHSAYNKKQYCPGSFTGYLSRFLILLNLSGVIGPCKTAEKLM